MTNELLYNMRRHLLAQLYAVHWDGINVVREFGKIGPIPTALAWAFNDDNVKSWRANIREALNARDNVARVV